MITKGQKINDRYEIIRSIGEGGMANVYLGYDTILDRKVAVKVLRGDLAGDEKFVRRFQREALSASSLSHPNIVEMYDVGEDNGIYYIVMEYIEGETLKQLLKRRGKLTLSEALDIMLQLTDGMASAHDAYIIHRDLKPQNIMIKDDGQIKITDFGIAMALNSTQLTQTNSVMGSVHYLPPEQASGKGSTIRSDIYSMGIIFYELLTGELPFRGDNAVEIALKQMKEPIPDVREFNKEIPTSVYNVIKRATAKNPKNRYTDAREMHDDLLTVLDDDRLDEEEYQFKYPEKEENTKAVEKLKDLEKKENQDEDIAEKIEEKENKLSKKIIIMLSIIAALIVVALVVILFVIPEVTKPKTIEIPDVSKMTVNKAEKMLQSKGLDVNTKIKSEYNKDIKKGYVIKTSPSEGRSVKEGTKITIYKSLGVKKYTLEDYVGKSYSEVQQSLNKNGIKVSTTKEDPTADTCKYVGTDNIIWQSLASDSKVESGDSITFKTLNSVTFPNFKGKSSDEVSNWANNNCVTLNIEYQTTSDISLKDVVITQSRPSGANVKNNDSMTIEIGQYQEEKQTEQQQTTQTQTTTSCSKNNLSSCTTKDTCEAAGGVFNSTTNKCAAS